MRAAGWLLLALLIPILEPIYNLEGRYSCPPYVALEAATFSGNSHGMTGTRMCFRPAVHDWDGPTACNVPSVQQALGRPVSRRGDDQVSLV